MRAITFTAPTARTAISSPVAPTRACSWRSWPERIPAIAGRGGSMHIVDTSRRLMSATGIVGGTIPLALGTALVAREQGNVVAVYFGDGASNTGSFHECLNMASLWKLPAVLVCENNGYAEFTPMSAHTVVSHVSVHGQPYGMASEIVDG